MPRPVARTADHRTQVSSTSPTIARRRYGSLVGAFLMSTATVASIGRAAFLRRGDWPMMKMRLRGSLIRCGAGFVKSVSDGPTPGLTRNIFCQMPGHDMEISRPIEHKRSENLKSWWHGTASMPSRSSAAGQSETKANHHADVVAKSFCPHLFAFSLRPLRLCVKNSRSLAQFAD
jgi:hypothetical protein